MQKIILGLALLAATNAASSAANAQFGAQNRGAQGGAAGGVFDLPEGVRRVVSVDAHNILMIEVQRPYETSSSYEVIPVRHVYSGGIAKLFGGTSIPTEQFVSPGFANGFGGGNAGGGNFGGGNFGVNGIGNGQNNNGQNNQFGNFGQNTGQNAFQNNFRRGN